jgi:RNA polymerase sigma-70 factor (ECF subfamily)
MVFRRCRGILRNEDDALDALQDVFVKLINAGDALQGEYPSSLLYTMATNTCLNRIRWRRRHPEGETVPEELPLAFHDQGFDEVEAKLIMEAVLQTESEETRAICFMYHADGMTLREIGEAVGLSISGVRKRLVNFSVRARIRFEEGTHHE